MTRAAKPIAPAAGEPQWIFPWRPRRSPWLPKFIAVGSMAGAFAFVITTVRVEVHAPEKSAPRKASVILLGDDPESRELALRAREGGPFPSRFDPRQWAPLAGLERSVLDAARFQPPPYAPAIPELPTASLVKPIELAARGQRFFPKYASPAPPAPPPGPVISAPRLYPLAGITAATLPRALPPFDTALQGPGTSATWRFMLHLAADGSVIDAISLEDGRAPLANALDAWLRRITFPSHTAPRWIAVGVGFANQPAADGADPR